MAITYLSSRGYSNNNGTSVLAQPTGTGISYLASRGKAEEEEKNVGGLLGGIGYLGEKVAVGTVSSLEGISDYTFSGLAKLFGNDAWAEEIIANDWFGDWYSHPEEWFNPGKGWQVAGDVAGGIGTSIPAMAATVGAAIATGGASALVQAGAGFGASFLTSGLGAAGRATKEAYDQTGKLTGKEFGYGALSGATEGGLEGLTNLIGVGTGAVVKSLTKSLAKETGEALMKNAVVEGIKSFAGEAFEEGVSEWLTPYWQRATYDPRAQNATADEIMYSAVVGGLSGLVMDGGKFAFDKGASYTSGVKAAKNNTEAQILSDASDIIAFENKNQTGSELFSEITRISNKLSESLKATGGKAVRADQQMELGALKRATVAASGEIGVAKRAMNIVNNADTIAERLTAYGYKKADGTPITYTADQLTAGYDKTRPQSIFKAIETNDILRSLSIADFTGHLMMDTNKFKQATLTGERLAGQVDLNRFVQQASPEEIAAVSKALGIDSWSGLTAEAFNQKITDFLTNGGVQSTLKANELKKAFKAIPTEQAQGVPKLVNLLSDGTRRYTDGKLDIGVELKGDKYTIYDYNNDTLSRGMSKDEVNSVLRDYSKRNSELTIPQSAEPTAPFTQRSQEHQARIADIIKFQNETREIDSFARENLKEKYTKLSEPSKSMIQNVIREGRKNGLSDEDVTMLARVSAHSGIDIQFDDSANFVRKTKSGKEITVDGFYEADKNRIVMNPNGKRTAERLLIHELDHAITKDAGKNRKKVLDMYKTAIKNTEAEKQKAIAENYGDDLFTAVDETNAYYAEQVLGNKYTLEKLLEAEPTLKDKILSFFKGASTDYADVPKLSSAAKKYYKTYKKLFDEFSARNYESNANENTLFNTNNAAENTHLGTLFAKNAQKTPLTNINQEDMSVSGRDYAIVALENGNTYVTATRKVIKGTTRQEQRKEITHFFDVLLKDKPSLEIHTLEGDILTITKAETADKARDDYKNVNKQRIQLTDKEFAVKLNAESHIDELSEIARSEKKGKGKNDEKNHSFAQSGFTYRTAYFEDFDGQYYKITLSIGHNGQVATVYNVGKIEKNVPSSAKIIAVVGSKALDETFSDISIPQKSEKSNTFDKKTSGKQYALDIDSDDGNISGAEVMSWLNRRPESSDTSDAETKNLEQQKKSTEAKDHNIQSEIKGGIEVLVPTFENTKGNVARTVKQLYQDVSDLNVAPKNVMAIADKYFDRYDGSLSRSVMRIEFLKLAKILASESPEALDMGYDKSVSIAGELMMYEKDISGYTERIKEIKKHIRGINLKIHDQDKVGFDAFGGYGEFRKRNLGRLRLGKEGAEVDVVYAELRNTYGYDVFPEVNSIAEMVEIMAGIGDKIPEYVQPSDDFIESVQSTADSIFMRIGEAVAKGYPDKPKPQLSRKDAESYIKQLNAKYEVKFAKTKARLEAEADARAQSTINAERRAIEAERSRLNAEYRTDRVYNEKSIEERLYSKVEEFKYLKKDVKERLVRDLFLALNESNGAEWRKTVEIEFTVKIVDEILHNPNSNYNFTNPSDRRRLNTSVSKVVGDIAKIGRLSEAVKLEKRLKQEAKTEANARQRILTGIQQTLKKIDDKKKKRFMEASAYKSSEFGKTIETLTKMEWRSGFSSNIARDSMKVLSDWYTADNPMLFPPKNNENSFSKATAEYNPAISGRLKMLSEGEGEYTANELQALSDVLSYFTKLIDEYDKVYLEGKWQDGAELSKMLKKTIAKQEKMGVPIAIRAMRNKLLSTGFRTFGDALSVIKLADMYGDGIYTRYYNEWLQGEINADAEAMEIKSKYDEFMKGHRRYLKDAETETVNLHGQSVRKIDLISYAMTLKREQAWNSIVEGGVVFVDPKHENKVTLKPIKVEPGIGYKARLEAAMKAEQEAVMGMLNKTDIEYMTILEEGFELAKVAKTMGDMQRLGFINVIEGYYYPIKHAYTDHLTDFNTEIIATDRYAYASFNKSAIEEANSAIIIRSADTTFNSHIKGVTRYLYLSPVMDSFNKLYKLKATDMSLHRTIEESKTAWRHDGKLVGFDYLQNIMLDTMGMGKNVGDDFFAKIRGASVNFALGANPKVLVTQLSSLISSTSVLSGWSHVGAVGLWNGNIVDDYSVVAKLRDSDYTVAKAEGVIDRINTSTRIFTAGISLMDRFVVTRAWAACQVEVAKNGGPAVGTEDNRIAAGKLLDKVILETQQNSLTSRRTEGARRGNILTKSMQMYKSDAITLFGRVADGVGEVTYLRALLKNNSLADAERQSIETRLENAGKGLAKSVGAVVGNAVFMMLITEMFRNFYGKNDDETEEEKKNRIVLDAIGNLLSGMPIVSEIYSYFTSGYSLDSMEMSSINDFLDTAQKVIDYTEKKLEGKATERDGNKLVQDMLYGAGQLLGVPTRNMKNVAYGVVRLFSKDAAYKWDNALYKKSYSADLNEAVAKGDIGRATMIMELALKEKLGSGFSTGAISELTRLAGLGEKVTPSAIGNTITVNGEEFTLDADQYGAVRAEYDKVISATNDFIDSKFYKSLNDEQKAKALRKLYATYKDIAYDTVLGTNRNERAVIMSKLVKGDVLNAYLSLGVIESDKDAQGNTISGSKRAKVVSAINGLGVSVEQRLLLICASGYALKDGDIRGVTAEAAKVRLLKYILRMKGLTADERAEIAEMCGFEVKNGKIVNNFSKNLKKISSK